MTVATNPTVITGDGRRVRLGALIKSGGAGSVYRLHDDPRQVAKLYHANVEHALYARKVAAMLELTPDLPVLESDGQRFVQLAWPQAAIYDGAKKFLGYLMPAVDVEATSELECILQERQARAHKLPTGLGAKVTLAANLSAVIAALHGMRHCVVDLKPVNLRFYRQSLYMAMLDCDGFSIQGHGERFEAPQYTPDYLAPEFHARGLTVSGEQMQDRFALAVVVFQLLNFGIHPFTGRPQSERVPTDIPARIAGRWYGYGIKPNASMLPSPTSGHATMPDELRQLFDRAFESAGSTRPSADEWAGALRGYAQRSAGKLVVCRREAAHQHFAGQPCAACVRNDVLSGAKAAARAQPTRTPVVGKFAPMGSRAGRTTGGTKSPASVLSAAQQRWAQSTAAKITSKRPAFVAPVVAGRRHYRSAPPPAGSPIPPTHWPPPAAVSGAPKTFVQKHLGELIFLGLWVVVMLVMFGYQVFRNWQLDSSLRQQAEESARQRAATALLAPAPVVATPPVPVAPPSSPDALAVRGMQLRVDQLAVDIVEGNEYGFSKALEDLRRDARARDRVWRAHAASIEGNGADPDRIAALGREARLAGWKALETNYATQAELEFLEALWADPRDADAWFGYGLARARRDARQGSATLAIALLHYPTADAASARRAELQALLSPVGAVNEQTNITFDRAGRYAEHLRMQLPPGLVALDEPFTWKKPPRR